MILKKLYLIPVPLADNALHTLSPQIKEIIIEIDYFLVENIRSARRFISSLKTGKVIENLIFFELDKKTSEAQLKEYFDQIPADKNIGVLSEAGCPGIADPGALAVEYAHRKNIQVIPLVGPSSIVLALMASGMNGQSFTFHGYLPIDRAERVKAIKFLEKEAKQKKQTQIFMETPFRNNGILNDLLQHLQIDTLLCVATNITAENQLIETKKIKQWREKALDLNKQPTIFLIGG